MWPWRNMMKGDIYVKKRITPCQEHCQVYVEGQKWINICPIIGKYI